MLLLTACGTAPQSQGGPVQDQVSLIDALRVQNLRVDISGTVSQPFLTQQSGTTVRVRGADLVKPADLQLFEYGSDAAATAESKRIRPDGSGTGVTIVDWIAPPHFFLKGRILVLYVGNDAALLRILQSLLGTQFAGD